MKGRGRRLWRRLAGACLLAPLLAIPLAARGATPAPPFEPDPGSAGSLTFYDASGNVVTGGSTSAKPFVAYVGGSVAVRPEDTKATLFGYLPKKGVAPGAFSGQQMSFSTAFPLPAGPASLKESHLPVVALTATDPGLQDLLAAYPNPATDAYAGLYVLRIRTFAVGEGLATTYLSADIAISGNTWTQVYPVPRGAATATLPAPAVGGTSVAAGPAGAPASGAGAAGPAASRAAGPAASRAAGSAASAAAGPTVGAAGSGSTALPRTGAESGPMLGLGSSLEVAGVLALATARRRRRPTPRHAYGPEPRHARARGPRHQF